MQLIRKKLLKNSSKNITFGVTTNQNNFKKETITNNLNYVDSEYQRVCVDGTLQLTGNTIVDTIICDSQSQQSSNVINNLLNNVILNDGSNKCISPDFIGRFAIDLGELHTINDTSLNITETKSTDIIEVFDQTIQPQNYTISTDGEYNLSGNNTIDLTIRWEKTNGTCTEFNFTLNLLIVKADTTQENIQLVNYDTSDVLGCLYDDDINNESIQNDTLSALLNYNYDLNLILNVGDKIYFYIDCNAYFKDLDTSTGIEEYTVFFNDNGSKREICLLSSSQQQVVQTLELVESRVESREANQTLINSYNNNNNKLLINVDSDATLPEPSKMTIFYIPLVSGNNIIDDTLKYFSNLVPIIYQDFQPIRDNKRFTALKSGKYILNLKQDIKFNNLTDIAFDFFEFNVKLVIEVNGAQTILNEYTFTPPQSNDIDIRINIDVNNFEFDMEYLEEFSLFLVYKSYHNIIDTFNSDVYTLSIEYLGNLDSGKTQEQNLDLGLYKYNTSSNITNIESGVMKIYYTNRKESESFSTSIINAGFTRNDYAENTVAFKKSFLLFELISNGKTVGYHFSRFTKENVILEIEEPFNINKKFYVLKSELKDKKIFLLKITFFNSRFGTYTQFFTDDGYDGYYLIYDESKNILKFMDIKLFYNYYELYNAEVNNNVGENASILQNNNGDYQKVNGAIGEKEQLDC